MLVPEAIQDGFVAATNALLGQTLPVGERVTSTGSFTDPEYAQVGLTKKKAYETHDAVTVVVHFNSTTRTISTGTKTGFCKLIADRATAKILGCHVVGERAIDIVQVATIAIAGGMRVDDVARVPLSFPTYAGIPGKCRRRRGAEAEPDGKRAGLPAGRRFGINPAGLERTAIGEQRERTLPWETCRLILIATALTLALAHPLAQPTDYQPLD